MRRLSWCRICRAKCHLHLQHGKNNHVGKTVALAIIADDSLLRRTAAEHWDHVERRRVLEHRHK